VAYAIVVRNDFNCNKEGGTCLPFGVPSYNSSVGSAMRGVVIYWSSRDRLPWAVLGLYLPLRYVATSPGVRRSLGVSMTS